MKFLTYSGNNLLSIDLPEESTIHYPNPPLPGLPGSEIPGAVERAFENPMGMSPLRELVDSTSRILIAFDDNCQPFPPMQKPDIRQIIIEKLLEMLFSYGVDERNIELLCAVALHRKMKRHELAYMLGSRIMSTFFPHQLKNFDAEDEDDLVELGETEQGEIVEISRAAIECDLIIYVDSVQIPLNGGHKSVSVGLAGYRTIACHHSPEMTRESPHVMQPDHSSMHASIERINRIIQKHTRIMVLEAAMNSQTYPAHVRYLSKPRERCNALERVLKAAAPLSMKLLPEEARFRIFSSIKSAYSPIEINVGSVDAVHDRTLKLLRQQLEITVGQQYDTLVFGLPDLSPYSVGARINPVLVVSDVLGYVFNWFYNKPFLKKGGVVIILNPVFEHFHPEYHAAYSRFFEEVLPVTTDPFEMQDLFQEKFARDPQLRDAYRNRWAHHGFHPFTRLVLGHLSPEILIRSDTGGSPRRTDCQETRGLLGSLNGWGPGPSPGAHRWQQHRSSQPSPLCLSECSRLLGGSRFHVSRSTLSKNGKVKRGTWNVKPGTRDAARRHALPATQCPGVTCSSSPRRLSKSKDPSGCSWRTGLKALVEVDAEVLAR